MYGNPVDGGGCFKKNQNLYIPLEVHMRWLDMQRLMKLALKMWIWLMIMVRDSNLRNHRFQFLEREIKEYYEL
jgi:hypothetical protein